MDSARVMKSAQQRWAAGDRAGAVSEAMGILGRFPLHAGANELLGAALAEEGRWEEAISRLENAIRSEPRNPELHYAIACARGHRGDVSGAAAGFRGALNASPGFAKAVVPLAHALLELGRSTEAETVLRKRLGRQADDLDAGSALAAVLADRADAGAALTILKGFLKARPRDHEVLCIARQWLNYLDATGEGEAAALREAHGRILGTTPNWGCPQDPDHMEPERPLRIGYLSPDLCRHSVAYFFEPLLKHHNLARFQITCYSTGTRDDSTTRRLRSLAGAWRDCSRLSDAELVSLIRSDHVDVLVELSGLTSGNRLAALAKRCAPVQVTYIGCPSSTGVAAMDYRMVDAVTDPEGSDRFASEHLERLPGCFLCYRPADEAPRVAERPLDGPVMFGSFNSMAKLTEQTARLWTRVVEATPGSELVLKGKALADEGALAAVRKVMENAGLSASRLRLLGDIRNQAEHLGAYAQVDIGLDPFPYNGTTTTCEAMWMGVPVVTLRGRLHASRVGASLLTAVGHPEWIADTEDDVVAIAARLAADRERLRTTRAALRDQMRASRLCDAAAHARAVEDAYRGMWRRWCAPDRI